ncbi:uncharacterized protein LOC129590099 isoform X1 [Paramacrobiotus metropolitanus]|uniref:uncharacterized protein LOC129590099 isoform X1 n=1 Tax=Paramacrobiotus metropolitanus TaxID=2943436 RepID=UPI002445B9BF|nr:uncharacterized protein LOC129590099 isoform X1 [Paramacrobiotus metropolitanus]XP_055341079.1 uncharacterized protein LOC129590099 isoform X1 [Paramacrobiotus metropolitanus]
MPSLGGYLMPSLLGKGRGDLFHQPLSGTDEFSPRASAPVLTNRNPGHLKIPSENYSPGTKSGKQTASQQSQKHVESPFERPIYHFGNRRTTTEEPFVKKPVETKWNRVGKLPEPVEHYEPPTRKIVPKTLPPVSELEESASRSHRSELGSGAHNRWLYGRPLHSNFQGPFRQLTPLQESAESVPKPKLPGKHHKPPHYLPEPSVPQSTTSRVDWVTPRPLHFRTSTAVTHHSTAQRENRLMTHHWPITPARNRVVTQGKSHPRPVLPLVSTQIVPSTHAVFRTPRPVATSQVTVLETPVRVRVPPEATTVTTHTSPRTWRRKTNKNRVPIRKAKPPTSPRPSPVTSTVSQQTTLGQPESRPKVKEPVYYKNRGKSRQRIEERSRSSGDNSLGPARENVRRGQGAGAEARRKPHRESESRRSEHLPEESAARQPHLSEHVRRPHEFSPVQANRPNARAKPPGPHGPHLPIEHQPRNSWTPHGPPGNGPHQRANTPHRNYNKFNNPNFVQRNEFPPDMVGHGRQEPRRSYNKFSNPRGFGPATPRPHWRFVSSNQRRMKRKAQFSDFPYSCDAFQSSRLACSIIVLDDLQDFESVVRIAHSILSLLE